MWVEAYLLQYVSTSFSYFLSLSLTKLQSDIQMLSDGSQGVIGTL